MMGKNQLISLLVNLLHLFSAYGAIREPWVKSVDGFFDQQDCVKLIEASEAFGFPVTGKFRTSVKLRPLNSALL